MVKQFIRQGLVTPHPGHSGVKNFDLENYVISVLEKDTCCLKNVFVDSINVAGGFTESSTTGITAFATGGQTNAVALTTSFNEVTTSATAGDSVKLPAAVEGLKVTVKNNGATAIDVFPATGDSINSLAVNTAIRLAPGTTKTFTAISDVIWEEGSEKLAVVDGTAAAPSYSYNTQPNMGSYKISSTQMGFSVSGTLVGGWNASGLFTNVIAEQTATVGVTVDGVLLKDGGVSANSMFAGFYPTAALQSLSGAGAVNVTSFLTNFTSTGAGDALTMADGTQIGQLKKVVHVVDGGSGVLTPANLAGGTTVTFTSVGEFALFIWFGTEWTVIELGNTATPGTLPVLA